MAPQTFVMPDKAQRDTVFSSLDVNGNGALSLAEIDKAVVELWPEFNNKPALMRAYKAADKSQDGLIGRREFRILLKYIIYFNNLWDKFDEIDTGDDRRISADDFAAKGSSVLGLDLTPEQAASEFRKIDTNHGGYILFDEFCAWAVKRQGYDAEQDKD